MATFNVFGATTKKDIRVGYIDSKKGLVEGVTICDANSYAKLNPGTQFIFRNRQEIQYLNINELNALEQAKIHLKQYSYREVAHWLSKNTERYISHVGLRKRIQHERQRKKTATTKRQWAKRLEEAIAAVKKIEEESLGAKEVSN